jgi:hypothetical protein
MIKSFSFSQFDGATGGNQFLSTLEIRDETSELLLDSEVSRYILSSYSTQVISCVLNAHWSSTVDRGLVGSKSHFHLRSLQYLQMYYRVMTSYIKINFFYPGFHIILLASVSQKGLRIRIWILILSTCNEHKFYKNSWLALKMCTLEFFKAM